MKKPETSTREKEGSFPLHLFEELETFLHQTNTNGVPALEPVRIHQAFRGRNELNSLQSRILFATTGGNLSHPLWTRYEEALARSIRLLGDTVLGAEGAKFANRVGSVDYFNVIAWRYAEIDAEAAMTIPLFQEIILARLKANNVAFFIKLGLAFTKSQTAMRIRDLNPIVLKMAEYWVHPDFPLWMMNNEAGSRYVEHLLRTDVSAENFAQIIKRHDLPRFGKFPICGVRISKDREFLGLELSRWIEKKV
jgi:hypothetical protein